MNTKLNSAFNWKALLMLAVIVSATLTTTTQIAYADDHAKGEATAAASASFDLSEMTCWDVMTLEEAERGTVLFLYYGYVSGTKGELVHDGATIAKILTQLGEHCNENPDDKLLELMTKGS